MASLKEIKSRIDSVESTQKITSAMKMIASVKLRRAEKQIISFYPYERKLRAILTTFLSSETEFQSTLSAKREVKRVAIIAFASNSSLCGSFNSNVTKRLNQVIDEYRHLGKENILIYTVGKKISQAVRKMGFESQEHYEELADNPSYSETQKIANKLIEMFENKEIDAVELVYHHFISKGSQQLTREKFLPIELNGKDTSEKENDELSNSLYLIEPSRDEILNVLMPKVARMKLFTVLLDSSASEHAARMIAMQIASDNAEDLLDELELQYNKSRQQAITNELLDIVGGSFGQN